MTFESHEGEVVFGNFEWFQMQDGEWVRLVDRNGIHTIPVPTGWSAEQAWEAIVRGRDLPETCGWTNVEVVEGRLVRWFPYEGDE